MRRVFLDTWAWIALGHRRDSRHGEVKQLYQDLRREGALLFSSDYVVDEVVTLLFRRAPLDEAMTFSKALLAATQGYLNLEPVWPSRFAEAWALREKFRDKPLISFTDLTTMVIMQELGITEVVTEDEHFHHVGMGFQRLP